MAISSKRNHESCIILDFNTYMYIENIHLTIDSQIRRLLVISVDFGFLGGFACECSHHRLRGRTRTLVSIVRTTCNIYGQAQC